MWNICRNIIFVQHAAPPSLSSPKDTQIKIYLALSLTQTHTETQQMSAVNALITFPQSIEHIKRSLPKSNKVFLTLLTLTKTIHFQRTNIQITPTTPSSLSHSLLFFFSKLTSSLQLNSLTRPAGVTVVFREVWQITFSKLLHFLCSHTTKHRSSVWHYKTTHMKFYFNPKSSSVLHVLHVYLEI